MQQMRRARREMTLALAATVGGFTLAALVSTACSALDPGEVDTGMGSFPEPSSAASTSPTGSSGDDDDGSVTTNGDGSTTPGDGGTTAKDSGTVVITPIPALFDAAPPWSANGLPTQTAASLAGTKHNFTPLGTNPFGQDCSSCHKSSGSASGFQWFIGGSISDGQGNGVGGAEVVMVTGDGGIVAVVYTDTDGNLWTGSPTQTGFSAIPDGAQVLVRLQSGVNQVMPQVLSAGTSPGCANTNCHGGSQGLPHVP